MDSSNYLFPHYFILHHSIVHVSRTFLAVPTGERYNMYNPASSPFRFLSGGGWGVGHLIMIGDSGMSIFWGSFCAAGDRTCSSTLVHTNRPTCITYYPDTLQAALATGDLAAWHHYELSLVTAPQGPKLPRGTFPGHFGRPFSDQGKIRIDQNCIRSDQTSKTVDGSFELSSCVFLDFTNIMVLYLGAEQNLCDSQASSFTKRLPLNRLNTFLQYI